MNDCLFCKIITGNIPSSKVFENEEVFGFKDINPMAEEHYLFIHKKHTRNITEMIDNDQQQVLDILNAINVFTKESDLELDGFRIVTNCGTNGGQTVFHTHFHVLGGEQLKAFGA